MADVAPPAVLRPGLRLVLFGMPAAGKSSLLGALAQSAQIQQHVLHGRIADFTHGLEELQHRLYAEKPQRTADEIVPYPIRFEPFAEESLNGEVAEPVDATLVDCDGRVANDLLVRREALGDKRPQGSLAKEVLEADAVLLVIDAAAPNAQIEDDFNQFGEFLKHFETGRGERSEVGGLPVFLVLTKCDLLAKPEDKMADWIERIEERKRQVNARFRAFLAKSRGAGPRLFGQIDLHLWATAVKRPPLAGYPGRPTEPYGVAELFRQSLEYASAFRRHADRSHRRLYLTFGAALGVLIVMALVVLSLVLFRKPEPPVDLTNKIDTLMVSAGTAPAERLKGTPAQLKTRLTSLKELRAAPGFANVAPDTRDRLERQIQELEEYLAFLDPILSLPPLASVGGEMELQALEEELQQKYKAPHPDWNDTDAAKYRQSRLEEIRALRRAVDTVENWYDARQKEGKKLWLLEERQDLMNMDWPTWKAKGRVLLDQTKNPPFAESDWVPGVSGVKYAAVLRFDRVVEARAAWEETRTRLHNERDVVEALGVDGSLSGPRSPLAISESSTFLMIDTARRVQDLQKNFPNSAEVFSLKGLPDILQPLVKKTAKASFDRLLEPARATVLNHLKQAAPGTEETKERWDSVRNWLADPQEFKDWRILATTLVKLFDPERPEPDPIKALSSFLTKDTFDLSLKRLALQIPERLGKIPRGDLLLYWQPSQIETPVTLAFELLPEKQTDDQARTTLYTLRSADRGKITFHPGDRLWAVMAVRDTDKPEAEWYLTWTRCRSERYQFERLQREPRLHLKDQKPTEGRLAEGVLITTTHDSEIPVMPDLMPVAILN